ncbi:TonB-dependent receptor [Brevifollis gellanilyticus]|uniref:Iron transport outer membrane receptor n=1 Tax=Brevifollis gellanilyticus TaxID=748831 RepID=A0A512M7R8_9BACT|nr:TonB-dependent siderophore receptor [Brevifollis gellanilyticus]GEP42779.1 iron transport outer membrane receptor [Brevifollis gellanilyticus]
MLKKSTPSSPRRARKPAAEALSVASLLCAAGSVTAQTAPTPVPDQKKTENTTEINEIIVEGRKDVYNPQRVQSPKFTEPVRNIPQVITVIPKSVIEDRGAFSLRDVLKNTPGISMQAGEGVSGAGTGDNLAIRGFSSRSDWFVDGIRDLGTYNRDPFNLEQVEVAKGPASTTTGRGTTGGSINLATKMATLDSFNFNTVSGGTNDLVRGTFDVNEKLSDHSAIRLNGMYHESEVAGRDVVQQKRYGLAASLAFGLGTDTRFTLNYQRIEEDNIPDFGIPWIPLTGNFIGAASSLGNHRNSPAPVDYDNFYGREDVDFQKTQGDMITAIIEHDFSDHLHIRNTTRYSRVHTNSLLTAPRFRDQTPGGAVNYDGTLSREEQRRQITNEFFTNQTLITADFKTGALKHDLVTGFEFMAERQLLATRAGITSFTNIFDPDVDLPLPNGQTNAGRDNRTQLPGAAEAHLDTVSAYVFDTISIGDHWQLSGGLRYDHIEAEARGRGTGDFFGGSSEGPTNTDDLFSWKAAIIYKPVEYGSIYFGYGTSFNATVDGTTPGGLGLNTPTNLTSAQLDPEESRSYELGTKWDLLKERLSLSAALFRTEKTNARTTFAGITSLAGDFVVDGVEIGASGQITKNWQIFAGAAHLDSKIKDSSNAIENGAALPSTPDYTFNLWTTYNIIEPLQVGFGFQYMGEVIGSSTNTTRVVPDFWTMDAMVSYRINDHISLRLNIYNLADQRYIETSGSTGHFIPGPGRSAALTASIKF